MSKQTAVQLLRESIDSEIKLGTKMVVNWDMYLAMEREQIEDAFQDGKWDWDNHLKNETESQDLAQYYNETYKK